MNRDYAASEVTVGSVWYVWGEHRMVVERYDAPANEVGAPATIPMVVLAELNIDGTPKQAKTRRLPIQAWRVSYYGQPSGAYAGASS